MQRTGQCLCGQIKLAINADNVELDVRHCKNCQLQSGSAFAPFLSVALDKLGVDGDPKCFADRDTMSGRTVRRYLCSDCGSPASEVVERAPTTAYVLTRLLDQTSDLRPKVHGCTVTKHTWVEITEGGLHCDMDPGLSPR
ncbi:MAG: GFA family protein [Pseudomonadota bacterium]|nr:GFA family protein [Pseudomonadota bacterium]